MKKILIILVLFLASCSEDKEDNPTQSIIYGESITYGNQIYKTVIIGEQIWMTENLNYESLEGESWCYDNEPANCNIYGRLYDWETAMSVCPDGWHLPEDYEWIKLIKYAGDTPIAERKLKAATGWSNCGPADSDNEYRCYDIYGFSALPSGYYENEEFRGLETIGDWWTATRRNMSYSYSIAIYSGDYYGNYYGNTTFWVSKDAGRSVRCVKN